MDVSSPPGKAKIFVRIVRNVSFNDLETSRKFGVRNSVLRGNGTEVFKALKARMDEADKYSS